MKFDIYVVMQKCQRQILLNIMNAKRSHLQSLEWTFEVISSKLKLDISKMVHLDKYLKLNNNKLRS